MNFFGIIASKILPERRTNSFYRKNIGKADWNGKRMCLTVSFDCDYSKDAESLPLLLDALSLRKIKAAFACVGKLIEKYPNEHLRIVRDGHEIINHTYSHPDNEELNPYKKFKWLSLVEKADEIKKCHVACEKFLNYKPAGFRTPHFGSLHSKDVYGILKNLGYVYSSSVLAMKSSESGMPFKEGQILEFPLTCCPKHLNAAFDTWHSLQRGAGAHKGRRFYELFRNLIEIGINTNSYINLYFDPQDVVSLPEFQLMLDCIKELESKIWVATYKELCEQTLKEK